MKESREGREERNTYVVDVMENVVPEWVENSWGHQEATNAHPKAVCKRGKCKSDNKVGEYRGKKHHKRFSRQEVEEEPHYPCEEGGSPWTEVGKPVRCY